MAKRKKVPNPAKIEEAEVMELTLEQRVQAQADLLKKVMERVEELHKWAQSVDTVVARNIPYIDAAALMAFKALDDEGKITIPEEWTPGYARQAQEKISDVVKLLQADVSQEKPESEGDGEDVSSDKDEV